MVAPSLSVSVHDRYTPELRDRIIAKLRESLGVVNGRTYRMLSPPALRRLAEFVSAEATVVSFYLQLAPERRIGEAWRTVFRSQVDATLRRIEDTRARRALDSELGRIESALDDELPALGRGAAFFACQAPRLWLQYAMPVPLPDGLHLANRPYIRPLARTHDEHDRFVLALLSKGHSRFFISQIGQVEEVLAIKGQRLDGSMLTDRVAKDRRDVIITEAMRDEAKLLAHAAELALAEFDGRYLLISSRAPELRTAVVAHFPKAVQEHLGGDFAVDPDTDLRGLAAAAEPTQRAIEEREETATVEQIREAGPAGAAWGEGPTLEALREGRVRLLAVDDMFAKPGSRCTNCRALRDAVLQQCPVCGSAAIEAVEDVVELALDQALEEKAGLEILRSGKARRLMAGIGRMAALLRW